MNLATELVTLHQKLLHSLPTTADRNALLVSEAYALLSRHYFTLLRMRDEDANQYRQDA